jgi:hypothetical protein
MGSTMHSITIGSGQPIASHPGILPQGILSSRLKAMGFWHAEGPAAEAGLPSLADVFPWWMMVVLDPDRRRSAHAHLGLSVASRRFGLRDSEDIETRTLGAISCGLPLGAAEAQAEIIHRLLLLEIGRGEQGDDEVVTAMLCGLAHLEGALGSKERWFAEAAGALVDRGCMFQEAFKAIFQLTSVHTPAGMIETIRRLLTLGEGKFALRAAGCLARFGEPGRLELERHARDGSKIGHEPVAAVLESIEGGTLDVLDPFLNDQLWLNRTEACRLVGDLIDTKSIDPSLALEVLLARMKLETDQDCRWVLCQSLGKAVAADPIEGIDRILSEVCELCGDDPSGELMDALSFGVGTHVDARIFEEMRDLFTDEKLAASAALNRCLTWIDGVAPSPADWFCPQIVKSLQWGRLAVPASVAPWFLDGGSMPGHLVVTAMHQQRLRSQLACLGIQHLNAHPDAMPIWEQLLTRAANIGRQDVWSMLGGVIAASRVSTNVLPEELRCAVGCGGPAVPDPTPAGAGRLLAISASRLEASKVAIRMLSQTNPLIREIAREFLAGIPCGAMCSTDIGALPPARGVGPRRNDAAPLGSERLLRSFPESLPLEYQPMFGMKPEVWRLDRKPFQGLIVSSQHRATWGKQILDSNRSEATTAWIQSTPREVVFEAIVACICSGVSELVTIGEWIASLVDPPPPDFPLTPLVLLARERHEFKRGEHPASAPSSADRSSRDYEAIKKRLDLDELL